MISETVTRRYVKALFQAAAARGQSGALAPLLSGLQELWLERGDLRAALLSPRLPLERKRALLLRLVGGEAPELMQRFLVLLLEKRRIEVLTAAGTVYAELEDEANGVRHAQVTSAMELTPDQERRLAETLSRTLEAQIVLTPKVDPAVIGGLMVRVGDVLIDGTVRARLRAVRERLGR